MKSIVTYHNASFPAALSTLWWVTFQEKYSIREAPLLALHSSKSCTKAITCILQIVTSAVVKKDKGEQIEEP